MAGKETAADHEENAATVRFLGLKYIERQRGAEHVLAGRGPVQGIVRERESPAGIDRGQQVAVAVVRIRERLVRPAARVDPRLLG